MSLIAIKIQNSKDTGNWKSGKFQVSGEPGLGNDVAIAYVDAVPLTETKGTIVLVHGYPETSYQFRYVVDPLVNAGYRVIVPDYRGAGDSSKPQSGYEKSNMAEDIHKLLQEHLGIKEKVHVVGHDIGGMVAYAYATRFAKDTATVVWGECPIPGSSAYDDMRANENALWHFHFHLQADLPEALTQGRERIYISQFYNRLMKKGQGITSVDVDFYEKQFSKHGAMRSGFDVYRAFPADKKENLEWVKTNGKCKVPSLSVHGGEGVLATAAESQSKELFSNSKGDKKIEGAGHWLAEEAPEEFVTVVLDFIKEYGSGGWFS